MSDIPIIIHSLSQTPVILEHLLASIPEDVLKTRRIPNKWSIHEHVCHLAQAEAMILQRFEVFEQHPSPEFHPYLPGDTVSDEDLIDANMREEIRQFQQLRKALLELVGGFDEAIWNKSAKHPQYREYNPYILLRHTLMHDHFHMYRVEELWLTKDAYLP